MWICVSTKVCSKKKAIGTGIGIGGRGRVREWDDYAERGCCAAYTLWGIFLNAEEADDKESGGVNVDDACNEVSE